MALVRAQWAFVHTSGLPEDTSVNTFYFNAGTPGTGDYDDIRDCLVDFYDAANPTAGARVGSFLSPVLSGDYVLKLYLLDDPEPRTPVATYMGTMSLGGPDGLPSEVALVLSFQATPVSGQNQARRRGRVFIGPLESGAVDSEGTRPLQQLRDALQEAAERLLADATTNGVPWTVYSKTGDTFAAVEEGWIDNSFDTQRRRGEAPTNRQTW